MPMIKHIIFTLHLQSVLYAGTRRRLAAKALLSDWVTSSSPGVNQGASLPGGWSAAAEAQAPYGSVGWASAAAWALTWSVCCWFTPGEDLAHVPLVGWVVLHVLSPKSCKSHSLCTAFHLPSVNAFFAGFLGSQALVWVMRWKKKRDLQVLKKEELDFPFTESFCKAVN